MWGNVRLTEVHTEFDLSQEPRDLVDGPSDRLYILGARLV